MQETKVRRWQYYGRTNDRLAYREWPMRNIPLVGKFGDMEYGLVVYTVFASGIMLTSTVERNVQRTTACHNASDSMHHTHDVGIPVTRASEFGTEVQRSLNKSRQPLDGSIVKASMPP